MQCNIDRRGRAARILTGAAVEAAGLGLLTWWYFQGPAWTPWVGMGCVVGGNFAMIEGALGWCAIRAMGFRTPL